MTIKKGSLEQKGAVGRNSLELESGEVRRVKDEAQGESWPWAPSLSREVW